MNILYSIVIFPIAQIIKIVYVLLFKIFQNPGLSVLGVSFTVTLLCLPLYNVAEKWQRIERETIKKLRPGMDKIKAVFRGDEQYMILSTYYRQNQYHPIYALRSSLGVLIQIPFFMAAYTCLSKLNALKGASFLFIGDLGSPDSIFSAGNFSINILPIAMTVINCLAGFIYTRDLSTRDKAQVYGLALAFLLLLYNAPSALALYWTMNNVLSLCKNIFYKFKNPLKILYAVSLVFAGIFFCYFLFLHDGSWKRKLFFCLLALCVMCMPLIIKLFNRVIRSFHRTFSDQRRRTVFFALCCAALTVLAGLAIPSSVIGSSPQEFSFIDSFDNPLAFLTVSFFQALGIFLFWPFCVYFLFRDTVRTTLSIGFFLLVITGFINVFVFSGNYGNISNVFMFDSPGTLSVSQKENLINIAIMAVTAAAVLFVLKTVSLKPAAAFTGILLCSLIFFSAKNIVFIQKEYAAFLKIRKTGSGDAAKLRPVFSLSKDRPNVIVFMTDGAISGFLDPIFQEHPKLGELFDGFTFYPNTVSYGAHTLIAVPAIWGGYEYTPLEMNRRNTVPLVKKHNEALFVLPTLFSRAGYSVTISDPSWANYSINPDITIFNGYENIQAVNLTGKYRNLWNARNNFTGGLSQSQQIINTIIWFSFLKIAPPFARGEIYDDGGYWSSEVYTPITAFLNSFSVLDLLPELTGYDSEKPAAIFITNDATHDPVFLQYPEYRPADLVTGRGTGPFADNKRYHVNNAFYLAFGKWLEALKKNGVYDNTRIIIVSDHGSGLNILRRKGDPIPGEALEGYNPLLLVKDFNRHGAILTGADFMTNADVPVLALRGIVENPENPFTGKPLTMNPKSEGVYITNNHVPMAHNHDKNTFRISDEQWIYIRDNIFETKNWMRKNPFDGLTEVQK